MMTYLPKENTMTKCLGCGVVVDDDKELCERCFRIKHYNEYKQVAVDNKDFIKILDSIPKDELVLLLVDLFNINDLKTISNHIGKNVILVLTKRDILPRSTQDSKFLDYNYGIKCLDKIIISSNKNYQLDELMELIDKYKKSEKVYLVGYTNAGKSTLINKIIYNYSAIDTVITTSPLPSTTLDTIIVKIDDNLTLIDTPGVIENGDIVSLVSEKILKEITPTKEIKPKTFQIKQKQYLVINDILIIEAENTNLTLFMANQLKVDRIYKEIDNLEYIKELSVKTGQDIVIQGLGFIKVTKDAKINLYCKYNANIYLRDSII